jgi:hypothetical protein
VARYSFHGLTLDLESERGEAHTEIAGLLTDLCWRSEPESAAPPLLRVRVRSDAESARPTPCGRELFRAGGFRGLEGPDGFHLTDEESIWHVNDAESLVDAWLSPRFFEKPAAVRRDAWTFGLLKLLRRRGLFSLHAAALSRRDRFGVLLVGESGCGKSTLALALVPCGWDLLSDDAVLVRERSGSAEVLALRRDAFIDGHAEPLYPHLRFGEERPDRAGGRRRRVERDGPRVEAAVPRLLVFPRRTEERRSRLDPISRADAFARLMNQSGSQLFDRRDTAAQGAVYRRLLEQAASFELGSGTDVLDDPSSVVRLLESVLGEPECRASS